jgi:tRNA threonylcarbamoyladenosine modification (KEOPS) complex  Pcc1 subunit
LLTGRRVSNAGNNSLSSEDAFEACCSWDFHIWLYPDSANTTSSGSHGQVNIPAVYLTINQGERLLQDLTQYSTVQVVLSARWRPTFNLSSYVIWALGVGVASVSAYLSAHSYHSAIMQARRSRPIRRSRVSVRREENVTREAFRHDDSVELTAAHAGLFLLMASAALLTLFFFKIYNVVRALYAMGCSTAVSQVVFDPIFRRAMASCRVRDPIVFRRMADFDNVSARDILSHLFGYLLGASWLVVGFMTPHAEELAFFWLVQNLFGASMCM